MGVPRERIKVDACQRLGDAELADARGPVQDPRMVQSPGPERLRERRHREPLTEDVRFGGLHAHILGISTSRGAWGIFLPSGFDASAGCSSSSPFTRCFGNRRNTASTSGE